MQIKFIFIILKIFISLYFIIFEWAIVYSHSVRSVRYRKEKKRTCWYDLNCSSKFKVVAGKSMEFMAWIQIEP